MSRGEAVEAAVAALVGQAGEELEERVRVFRERRPETERRAVAEDDVGGLWRDGRHRSGCDGVLEDVFGRAHDQHRARCLVDEAGRDAAGEEPSRGAPPVRADHDPPGGDRP